VAGQAAAGHEVADQGEEEENVKGVGFW